MCWRYCFFGLAKIQPGKGVTSVKVLVVDDEESVRDSLGFYLQANGHECFSAANGRAALEILEETSVDAIIADFVMPVFSGLEFLQEVRKRYPDHAMSIIMITGHSAAEDAQQAYDLGAKWVLQKPIRPSVLHELLSSLETPTSTST